MRPRWQRPVVLTAEQVRQLPAEPTAVVAARFGRTPGWLRQQRYLGRIQPTSAECRPLWWRPMDVYLLIHPDTDEARTIARGLLEAADAIDPGQVNHNPIARRAETSPAVTWAPVLISQEKP